jgi:hypothetical protein
VARITDMSHQDPAFNCFVFSFNVLIFHCTLENNEGIFILFILASMIANHLKRPLHHLHWGLNCVPDFLDISVCSGMFCKWYSHLPCLIPDRRAKHGSEVNVGTQCSWGGAVSMAGMGKDVTWHTCSWWPVVTPDLCMLLSSSQCTFLYFMLYLSHHNPIRNINSPIFRLKNLEIEHMTFWRLHG